MNNSPFTGKRALITGAARGQGREIALQLAQQGADVALCDIGAQHIPGVAYSLANNDELSAVAAEISRLNRRVVAQHCDVRDTAQVEAFVAAAVEQLGGLDIVVNNAGILPPNKPTHEATDEGWQTVIDINLTGVWRVSRATVPQLIAAGGGRIVNIASATGLVGAPGFGPYCAAKHGVVGLTKTMAAELAAHHITVNAVCPGLVDTPMVTHAAGVLADELSISQDAAYDAFLQVHHVKERITPQQTAAAVLYLAGEAARVVTGACLTVDGGWTAT